MRCRLDVRAPQPARPDHDVVAGCQQRLDLVELGDPGLVVRIHEPDDLALRHAHALPDTDTLAAPLDATDHLEGRIGLGQLGHALARTVVAISGHDDLVSVAPALEIALHLPDRAGDPLGA